MRRLFSSVLFAFAVACGSSSSSSDAPALPPPDPPPADDAGPPPPPDAGAPALLSRLPEAQSLGGPVIKNPLIVPVVWTSDPLAADIDTWLAAWDKTTYWGDMVAEYGIAKPKLAAAIHISDAVAASITSTDIREWLAQNIDGGNPAFPKTDENTFFMLVYPPGTTISLMGRTSCKEYHGFHDETQIASGARVSYAVISRCDSIPEAPVTGIQYVAAVASHEVLEGLADPLPFSNAAYAAVDPDHQGWYDGTGGEIGDLCALQGNAFFQPADFPYTVQKIWSNAAAKAGKDPCIPEKSSEPWFIAAAEITKAENAKYAGLKIPVGTERKVPLDVYSDGPLSGPMTLKAAEIVSTGHLTFTFDKTTASPGDKVMLTIKAEAAGAGGSDDFVIAATVGSRRNLWFGIVAH
jgi:hypothetical protein